jgi:hypothetical protein
MESNDTNIQVNRNSKELENWHGNGKDIDKQEEEEYRSDDEEEIVDGGAIEDNGGISGNRGRCVSTEAGGDGAISSVTTGNTMVTDMNSFWQHETVMEICQIWRRQQRKLHRWSTQNYSRAQNSLTPQKCSNSNRKETMTNR